MCRTKADKNCRNIRKVFEAASPSLSGLQWYDEAHMWAVDTAADLGYTVKQVVGATAAVSPQISWETNKRMMETLDWNGAYGTNIAKAELILAGVEPLDVLGGPKVRAFYRAILEPELWQDAVIDRHAISVWLGRRPTLVERNRYSRGHSVTSLQSCYARIAYEVGLFPHQLQAVTWVQWRDNV